MDFGDAIRALKEGKRVSRAGWNGKGMWLFLAVASELLDARRITIGSSFPIDAEFWAVNEKLQKAITPSICMKTAQDTVVVGWLASQTDMLAEDWEIVL